MDAQALFALSGVPVYILSVLALFYLVLNSIKPRTLVAKSRLTSTYGILAAGSFAHSTFCR